MGQVLSMMGLTLGGGSGRVLLLRDDGPPENDDRAAEAYETAQAALQRCHESLDYLASYRGNDALVKKVVASSDPDERAEAFEAMLPNIEAIKGFYDLSLAFEDALTSVLAVLVPQARGDVTNVSPELTTKLAQVLEHMFLFDWAKMSHPAVQNDFSFYRRELAKQRGGKSDHGGSGPVSESEASNISMFVAQGSPLLFTLSAALAPQARKDRALGLLLADLAGVAADTLLRSSRGSVGNAGGSMRSLASPDAGTEQTLVLAMVEAVVLFDAVDSAGAFAKGAPIDMKRVVSAIRRWDNELSGAALSTLQYSSRTFKNSTGTMRRLFT